MDAQRSAWNIDMSRVTRDTTRLMRRYQPTAASSPKCFQIKFGQCHKTTETRSTPAEPCFRLSHLICIFFHWRRESVREVDIQMTTRSILIGISSEYHHKRSDKEHDYSSFFFSKRNEYINKSRASVTCWLANRSSVCFT